MRCKEVILLISESAGKPDREVAEHLKACPACARAAEAAGVLERVLQTAREQDNVPVTPIADIREKIEALVVERGRKTREESLMAKLKNQINTRPALVTGLGLAVAVFLFITLVPFSYTQTVGYDLVFSGIKPEVDVAAVRGEIENAIAALGYNNVVVDIGPEECVILNLPSWRATREATIAFAGITGFTGEAIVKPVLEMVSGSLYAQVMAKYRIDVDTEGKSDEELAEEIRLKLISEGAVDPVVTVSTAGGECSISVNMGEEAEGESRREMIEIRLGDSGDISFGAPCDLDIEQIEAEGKTDAEIKAEIESRLAEQGQTGAKVEVTTDAEGKREVKICVEKEKESEE